MSATRPKRFDAFLSYNSQDSPAVHELAERLTAEGLVLYLEEWELAPGREFQPALAEGLTGSKACVVFLGPNGLGPWQKEELQIANGMRARDEAFHVIPVLPPGAEGPPGGGEVPLSWSSSSTRRGSSSSRRSTTSGPSGTWCGGSRGPSPRSRTSGKLAKGVP